MSVVIKGMQLPEKCCKCPIMRKVNSMCPLLGKSVVEPGQRRRDCPLEEVEE